MSKIYFSTLQPQIMYSSLFISGRTICEPKRVVEYVYFIVLCILAAELMFFSPNINKQIKLPKNKAQLRLDLFLQ